MQETAQIQSPIQSPYGVSATSVVDAPPQTGALLPFEQRQVQYLVNQYNSLPTRLQAEFVSTIIRT